MTQHFPVSSAGTGRGSSAMIAVFFAVMPGLSLATGLAAAALVLLAVAGVTGLSPLIVAMVLGMAVRNLFGPLRGASPGVAFAMRRVLRAAIVLLGFQITFAEAASVGLAGLAVIAALLAATFVFTRAAGRVLGVDAGLSELIAAGTAVCGASAVLACNTVTRAADEDVAYAVACVTVFGSLSMVAMPMLAGPLALEAEAYGLWVGAAVHEVAQVVAAAFAQGEAAGQAGTVAKLSRVMLLAPLVLTLGALARRRHRGNGSSAAASVPVPWFVFGFIGVVAANSAFGLPAGWHEGIALSTSFMLTVALAAMGLETDMRALRRKGLRPLLLGAAAAFFIAAAGLVLVTIAL